MMLTHMCACECCMLLLRAVRNAAHNTAEQVKAAGRVSVHTAAHRS